MPHVNELSRLLNAYFKLNKARMDCFAAMVIALFLQGEHQFNPAGQSLSQRGEAGFELPANAAVYQRSHCSEF